MASVTRIPLTISVIADPPRAMPCALAPRCAKRGIALDIANQVCQTLNYNCTFVPAKANVYGFFANGSWHGVINEIIEGKVDVGMPSFEFTQQRLKAVDFSGVFHYENYILLTRLDASDRPNLNFFNAFHTNVWLLIASLLILAGLVVPETIFFKNSTSFLEQLMQKWLKVDLPFSVREILICTLALVYLVLTQAYTGFLFSENVTVVSELPFTDMNTFVDCLETKKCTMGLFESYVGLVKSRLETNGSSVMGRLKNLYDKDPFEAYPLENLMKVVLDNRNSYVVTLITETDFYYAVNFEDQCKYYKVVLDKEYPPSTSSFPLRKNSPFREDLDLMASKFLDYGLLEKILMKYMSTQRDCAQSTTAAEPDTLKFLSGVFYFLGVGEGFAFLYFFGERIYFKNFGQNSLHLCFRR